MLLADETQGAHDDGNQPSKMEFFTPTLTLPRPRHKPAGSSPGGGTHVDPQFFPWCDSASPTSPLPWREGLEPAPYLIRGEGEKHTPGIVKLGESPGRARGLPGINYS